MSVYQSSLLDDQNNEEQATGFQRILDLMVDPAVEMCTTVGDERKVSRQKWDREVFVLNCLTFLQVGRNCTFHNSVMSKSRFQSVLEPFAFTIGKQKKIQDIIDERVKILTEQHVGAERIFQPHPLDKHAQCKNLLTAAGIHDAIIACETRQSTVKFMTFIFFPVYE